MIEISILKDSDEEDYTNLLYRCNESMLFHSIPYKKLLTNFLSAEPFYVIIRRDGRIIGAIPAILRKNKEYGNILNSLPFIGSNGGLIVDNRLNYLERLEAKKKLLIGYEMLAKEEDCVLSNIITSPFDRDIIFYEDNINYIYRDYRVGYIKEFNRSFNISDLAIMETVDRKCRNSIKRSQKNIELEYSEDFSDLVKIHKLNMEGKGSFKPPEFFNLVKKKFDRNDYELTYALFEGKRIAGLLVFYFKDTVEYFTPAFDQKYRSEQATSFLIFESMKKSFERGFKYWDFGGTTLPGQSQVAHFKKSWGSQEYPYYYYTIKHQGIDGIKRLSADEISKQYRWFYVMPFNKLMARE